jgi:hypothetical protein
MTASRRSEFICGLLCALPGLLALGIDFSAPLETYSTNVGNGVTVTSTTSYAQANGGVTFFIVLFGIPLVHHCQDVISEIQAERFLE